MRKIILVSHGTLAQGIYKAAKMIYGNLKNVDYLCLEENMDIERFRDKLNRLLETLKNSDEIIVLADLKGGSPYTSMINLLSENGLLNKSIILSGLNLPMLLSVLFTENKFGENQIEQIINEARDGIAKFELVDKDTEEL